MLRSITPFRQIIQKRFYSLNKQESVKLNLELEDSVIHLLKYNQLKLDVANLSDKYSNYKYKLKKGDNDIKDIIMEIEKEYDLLSRDNTYSMDNLRWLYDNGLDDDYENGELP